MIYRGMSVVDLRVLGSVSVVLLVSVVLDIVWVLFFDSCLT